MPEPIPATMRVARVHGKARVTVEQVPTPRPSAGEVLVRIEASALCGSELHAYRDGGHPSDNPGHEAAGVIVDAGDSPIWRVGDRVGMSAVQGCGDCAECRAGRYTFCRQRPSGGSPGWHAEYGLCRGVACFRLPDDVPFDHGVLLSGDGLGVPYHVSRRTRPQPGETVAIFGVGPVGLGNVLVNAFLGARVIAVDVVPGRLEYAERLGAWRTIDGRETDVAAAIRDLTRGLGAEICLECAGRPETARLALDCVATNGRVMCVGEQRSVEISPSRDLIRRDITLMGSWFYHFREAAEMLELYRRGLRVGELITHRFPLDQAAEAYRRFAAGETGKAILQPTAAA